MSEFYSGRHRAACPKSKSNRMGGVLAATALGLGTSAFAAGSASAAPAVPSAPAAPAAPALKSAPTAPALPATYTGYVRYGDRGDEVREVQRVVGVTVDGVFGPNTLAAVKDWQRSHDLVADGIVGPKTGSAMGLDGSSSSSDSDSSSSDTNYSSSSILDTAAQYVGVRYTYGGESPSTGFDCSGFTQYVFAKHGISLPRTAAQQQDATYRVSNPQPGDLVFFGDPAWHVGIYAGNGMMYDAGNSRTDVSKRAIWTSDVTYRRVG